MGEPWGTLVGFVIGFVIIAAKRCLNAISQGDLVQLLHVFLWFPCKLFVSVPPRHSSPLLLRLHEADEVLANLHQLIIAQSFFHAFREANLHAGILIGGIDLGEEVFRINFRLVHGGEVQLCDSLVVWCLEVESSSRAAGFDCFDKG